MRAATGSSSTLAAARSKKFSTNGDVRIPLHPTEPRENGQESGDRAGGDEQSDITPRPVRQLLFEHWFCCQYKAIIQTTADGPTVVVS